MPITPAVQTYCWDLSRHADLACPFYSALIIQLANFQAPDFLEKFAEPNSRFVDGKRPNLWLFLAKPVYLESLNLLLNWVLKIKTCSSHE